MGKSYSLYEIIRVLQRYGFEMKSQKGSHMKFVKGIHTVIVPHPIPTVPIGTFKSIVRQFGLETRDFE
jgi:predicted RNA binding protein YcfA (HicA-like mRNA interferase family)